MELLRRNYPFQIVARQESGLDWLMSGIVRKTHSNGSRDRIVEAPLDIQESENNFVVQVSIPGVSLNDIRVSVEHSILDIKVDSMEEDSLDEMKFLVRERNRGFIHRSVTLPESVDLESSKASYSNGVLTVNFNKLEIAKPRLIEVKASE